MSKKKPITVLSDRHHFLEMRVVRKITVSIHCFFIALKTHCSCKLQWWVLVLLVHFEIVLVHLPPHRCFQTLKSSTKSWKHRSYFVAVHMDTGGLEYNTQYIMSVGKTHSTARLIFHVSESPKSANQSNYCVVTEDRQRKKKCRVWNIFRHEPNRFNRPWFYYSVFLKHKRRFELRILN